MTTGTRKAWLLLLVCAATARAQSSPPTVNVRTTANEITVDYGPLVPSTHATHDGSQPAPAIFTLPADGWLNGFTIELVDAAGRKMPDGMVHHMNLISVAKRDLFTNEMMRIVGVGSEMSSIQLPRPIGFDIRRGDTVAMVIMVHQIPGTNGDPVTARLHLNYTPSTARIGRIDVHPWSIAIGVRGQPNLFNIPPGRSEHQWEGSPTIGGRILGLTGHMHQYGQMLRFEDKTDNKVLWEAAARVDSTGAQIAIPVKTFIRTLGLKIRPDHVYRLTATYLNPTTDTVRAGGMGVIGGVMMISGDTRWPAVDRTHPDYLADSRELLGPKSDTTMHHAHPLPVPTPPTRPRQ